MNTYKTYKTERYFDTLLYLSYFMPLSARNLFLAVMLIFCSSCDVVKYIAVNNYGERQPVTVIHTPQLELLWESDTLNVGRIGDDDFDTVLLRTNLDTVTYQFMAPANSHIELMPKAWENPIRLVRIGLDPNSVTINLDDKKQMRKLRKQGIIETSGLPVSTILININKPASGTETNTAGK